METDELRDFVSWNQETEMTDPIIIALKASLAREYFSRKVRLSSWLLVLVAESMQTVGTTTVIPKC